MLDIVTTRLSFGYPVFICSFLVVSHLNKEDETS